MSDDPQGESVESNVLVSAEPDPDFDTKEQAARNACEVLGNINPSKVEPYKG